jgi:hypothetical protein
MADPTKYERDYSFADFQANSPSRPLPGPELDIELDNIADRVGEAVDAIKDIRRSDGALKNGIVTVDALAPGLRPDGAAAQEAADRAEAAAADAEAAAAVLEGFAERVPFSGVTVAGQTDYDLPFNPINQNYLRLDVGGTPQQPGDGFVVITKADSASGYGFRLTPAPLGAIGFWGYLDQPKEADPNAQVLTLEQFGVLGNNTGDQGPAIISAIAAAAGRKLIGTPGAVYRIETPVDYTGPFDHDFSGCDFHFATEAARLTLRAPTIGKAGEAATVPALLTADYTAGDLSLAVEALSEAPAPGDSLVIWSNAADPANRYTTTTKYRVAELVEVGLGSTTTSVVINRPLRFLRGCDPASVPTDEAYVDAYSTAWGARVGILKRVKAQANPPTMYHTEGQQADWQTQTFAIVGHINAEIKGGAITRGYGNGFRLIGTRAATVLGFSASNLENNTSNGQFGYGIASNGTGTKIIGLTGSNTRHLYTTNAIAQAENLTDIYAMLASCRCVGDHVIGGYSQGGANAPFDTHHCATDVIFTSPIADSPLGTAFAARGVNIRYIDPVVRNGGGSGLLAFTDNQGGNFVYGREPEDYTTCYLFGGEFDCAGAATTETVATLTTLADSYYEISPRLEIGANSVSVTTDGGTVRLVDTDTSLSNGEDASGIVFVTNDASNPNMEAAAIAAVGNGTTGFVDLFFRRKNVAGPLVNAIRIQSNGSIQFFASDGATVASQLTASTGFFALTPPGPYADDTAAAAAGVAVGQLYRVTGGTLAWRQV